MCHAILLNPSVFVQRFVFGADYSVSAHPRSPGCLPWASGIVARRAGLVALGAWEKKRTVAAFVSSLKRITGPDGHD